MINGLAVKLKELRIKRKLTQKEVAKRLDISASIVSSYETGERTPSTEIILALANLYNVSTDYLLGKDKALPSTTIDVSHLTPDQIEALMLLIKTIEKA